MPVIQNGLWSSFLLTACLMLFSYHPLCIWCLPVVQQWGRKTDTMIVSAVQLILFCIIMDRAAVNKSPLVLLGSDGRLPVWLRDGVIADLVATLSDIPYLLSREESQPLMFTDNCIDGPFFSEPCITGACIWKYSDSQRKTKTLSNEKLVLTCLFKCMKPNQGYTTHNCFFVNQD